MKNLHVAFFVLASVVQVYGQQVASDRILNVTVDGFKEAIDSLQDEVVIDLRTPEELKGGKVPGALVIDFFGPDFEPAIAALDRDKTYLLYCASGGRSGETAQLMAQMGFKKIYNMEEGFRGWSKKRFPIEKDENR